MIPARPIWRSKLVWFNVLMTIVEILSIQEIAALVPPSYLAIIQLIGNVLLRRITAGPVTWTPPPEAP